MGEVKRHPLAAVEVAIGVTNIGAVPAVHPVVAEVAIGETNIGTKPLLAIEGVRNFIRNGCKLDIPDAVEEATDAYRQREDWLNSFLEERCIRDERARTAARALYLEYRSWASDSGEFVRRKNDFSAAMEGMGFRKVKISGKPTYKGISIDTDTLLSRVS